MVRLMETVARTFLSDVQGNESMRQRVNDGLSTVQRLQSYCQFLVDCRPHCATRMRFMIDELLKLRDQGWPETKATGPQTKKQVAETKAKEKLEAVVQANASRNASQAQLASRGSYGSQQQLQGSRPSMGQPGQPNVIPRRPQPTPAIVQHTDRDRIQVTATLQNKGLSAAFAGGPFGNARPRTMYGGRDSGSRVAGGAVGAASTTSLADREHSQPPSGRAGAQLSINTTASDDRASALAAAAAIKGGRTSATTTSPTATVAPSQSSPQLNKLLDARPSLGMNTTASATTNVTASASDESTDTNTTIAASDSVAENMETAGKGWLREVNSNWHMQEEKNNERIVAQSITDILQLGGGIDQRVRYAARALLEAKASDVKQQGIVFGRLLARLCQQGRTNLVIDG